MVHYTVTVTNNAKTALNNVQVRDGMPHDVPYVKGSTLTGGVKAADPGQDGQSLVWHIGDLAAGKTVDSVTAPSSARTA